VEQELTKAFGKVSEELDPPASDPGARFALRGMKLTGEPLRGFDAAQMVFDLAWEAVKERKRPGEILDLAWSNLANPLFLIAVVLTLFGRIRPAVLLASLAALSSARWLFENSVDVSNLKVGYWTWLGSIVLGAVACWRLSLSAPNVSSPATR
jgi:hypothetical protein